METHGPHTYKYNYLLETCNLKVTASFNTLDDLRCPSIATSSEFGDQGLIYLRANSLLQIQPKISLHHDNFWQNRSIYDTSEPARP